MMRSALRTPPNAPVSVLIAARRASTRSALWALLDGDPALEPVATASDLTVTVRLLRAASPDVAVIDSGLLRSAGVTRLATLASASPATAFIVIGMGDHPGLVARARAAGAADYVRLDQASERLARVAVDAALAHADARRTRAAAAGVPR